MNLREEVLTLACLRSSQSLKDAGIPGFYAVETGTARNTADFAHEGDGWSTPTLARFCSGFKEGGLFSIDIEAAHIEASRKIVPSELHPVVHWALGNSPDVLNQLAQLQSRIDLLYLDSADDPALIMKEFTAASRLLKDNAVVVIDDCEPYDIGPLGKGSELIPFLKKLGWQVTLHSRNGKTMAVAMLGPAWC